MAELYSDLSIEECRARLKTVLQARPFGVSMPVRGKIHGDRFYIYDRTLYYYYHPAIRAYKGRAPYVTGRGLYRLHGELTPAPNGGTQIHARRRLYLPGVFFHAVIVALGLVCLGMGLLGDYMFVFLFPGAGLLGATAFNVIAANQTYGYLTSYLEETVTVSGETFAGWHDSKQAILADLRLLVVPIVMIAFCALLGIANNGPVSIWWILLPTMFLASLVSYAFKQTEEQVTPTAKSISQPATNLIETAPPPGIFRPAVNLQIDLSRAECKQRILHQPYATSRRISVHFVGPWFFLRRSGGNVIWLCGRLNGNASGTQITGRFFINPDALVFAYVGYLFLYDERLMGFAATGLFVLGATIIASWIGRRELAERLRQALLDGA